MAGILAGIAIAMVSMMMSMMGQGYMEPGKETMREAGKEMSQNRG